MKAKTPPPPGPNSASREQKAKLLSKNPQLAPPALQRVPTKKTRESRVKLLPAQASVSGVAAPAATARDYSKVRRNPEQADLHLRPSKRTLERLRKYCRENGVNMSDVFDRAISGYLDQAGSPQVKTKNPLTEDSKS